MVVANIVGFVPNSWGHIKPLIALFERMAEHQPASAVIFTILSSAPMMLKIQRELELMSELVSQRINVIDVGAPENAFLPMVGFAPVFEALWEGKSVVCKTTGKKFMLPRPTIALVDGFCHYVAATIRTVSGGSCPVLAWVTHPMSAGLYLGGPEDLGGYGDLNAKLEAAAAAAGKTINEVADSVCNLNSGTVKKVAGVPDMYDYEYEPQERFLPFSPAIIVKDTYSFFTSCDGMVLVSSSAFERESIQAGRTWIQGLGKELWIVGPLEGVPSVALANIPGAEAPQHTADDAKILGFLDDMEKEHGKNSVIFIAHGTNFVPKDPAKLYAFIDELIKSDTPFLWSHASPWAKVPDELTNRIDASSCGHHAMWVPQRTVLQHAATGWFVSHGGWNSTQEALSLRVPMIMWPFGGDQVINSIMLSVEHEAAFELISVREAGAARQPLRLEGKDAVDFSVEGVRQETRALLKKIKGAEGARVRTNAERLGEALGAAWNEGGEARHDLERLLSKFVV